MPEIRHKIKELRLSFGMTQDAFAAALRQKPSKIRDIEAGRQRVNDQFVSTLAETFLVDLNWLFSVEGQTAQPLLQLPTDAITHEDQSRASEPPRQNRARVVLAELQRLEKRISDSLIGDVIGVIAIFAMLCLGLFVDLVLK